MASLRKRGNVWYYRFVDADGVQHERKGCTGRRETEEMAAASEAEASKVKNGLIDPRDIAFRDHGALSLALHFDEWRGDMLARGRTVTHADLFIGRASRLVAVVRGTPPASLEGKTVRERERVARKLAEVLAGARFVDLTPDRVQTALGRLRDFGKSLQTVNHYRSAFRAFCRWSMETGRIRDNPARGVKGFNVREDRRHERRTLTGDELARLIRSAETGPTRFGMSGPMRAMAYRLAAATGFRVNELRALTRESFDLEGDEPSVFLPATATKNRRPVEQPIPLTLKPVLARWLADKPTGAPVLPLDHQTAKAIKADLEDAGIAYRTDSGVADFHALRAYYVSALVGAGADIKEVQTLARHAAPQTTLAHYAKVKMHDLRGAVESLPVPSTPDPRTEAPILAATGTEGAHIKTRFALPLPYEAKGKVAKLKEADGSSPVGSDDGPAHETLEFQASDGSGRALKEVHPVGLEPTTYGSEDRCEVGRNLQVGQQVTHASANALPFPCPTEAPKPPPDLAVVVESWGRLPEAIRAGIVAMVRAAAPSPPDGRNVDG